MAKDSLNNRSIYPKKLATLVPKLSFGTRVAITVSLRKFLKNKNVLASNEKGAQGPSALLPLSSILTHLSTAA
jgi:hypothetical protein